ncbi:MAG TPA: hypothetical protein VGI20_10030 [Rhizomicrobium sp.]|jgi:hypothetical protein
MPIGRRIIRHGVLALGVAAFLVVTAGGLFFAMKAHFNPAPPPASYAKPANALEAQRQDLNYFGRLVGMDRSYSLGARATAMSAIVALGNSNTVLERQKFRVALMEIAALADNGHTHVGSGEGADPKRLPVRVALFSDGLYIMRARYPYADVLGARVEALDGVSTDQAMRRLEMLRGGVKGWRRLNASFYASLQDVLYGAGIARSPTRSVWSLLLRNGTRATRTFDAYQPLPNEPLPFPVRWYSPEPLKNFTAGWRTLQINAGATLPVSLTGYADNFRRVWIPHSRAVFIQLKAIEDADGQGLGKFLGETESDLRTHPPCEVILDLRYSIGGDFTQIAGFGGRLPNLVAAGGHIYILTSAMTFSASIATAAFVKQAGGNRVEILGEPIGDRLAFFSEGGEGCLPNYHLCLDFTTGKNDFAAPCTDPDICFWPGWVFPARVKTLEPDELITTSFADWLQGRDPVLERALVLARTRR